MSSTESRRIHLIAIGGAVMHNLAITLSRQGHVISGSDDHIAEPSLSRLQAEGLMPDREGWYPENIHSGLDEIILGMHARADNPELSKAKELGLPIRSFPEFLYLESAKKLRVAICGSHGKTTITAMLMHVLRHGGKRFDYMVGAQLKGFEVMVSLSDAPIMVLEGDEYLSSALDRRPKFLHYRPRIALISGIAWDHINVFPTLESYLDAFRSLITSLTEQDFLVWQKEDAVLASLIAEGCKAQCIPYQCPDFAISEGQILARPGSTKKKEFSMSVIGRHNLLNAAGAAGMAQLLGLEPDEIWEALSSFSGAARRLELVATGRGRMLIRDFAHSPSKVLASTSAVADQMGAEGLCAVLELHTFSSLNPEFLPQYQSCLNAAGKAIVFYDPAAVAAKKLPLLSPESIREALGREDLEVYSETEKLVARLEEIKSSIKCLLLMSSGTFGGMDTAALGRILTH